jgi:hypothetical protein
VNACTQDIQFFTHPFIHNLGFCSIACSFTTALFPHDKFSMLPELWSSQLLREDICLLISCRHKAYLHIATLEAEMHKLKLRGDVFGVAMLPCCMLRNQNNFRIQSRHFPTEFCRQRSDSESILGSNRSSDILGFSCGCSNNRLRFEGP